MMRKPKVSAGASAWVIRRSATVLHGSCWSVRLSVAARLLPELWLDREEELAVVDNLKAAKGRDAADPGWAGLAAAGATAYGGAAEIPPAPQAATRNDGRRLPSRFVGHALDLVDL
jgi:hypothetical protein